MKLKRVLLNFITLGWWGRKRHGKILYLVRVARGMPLWPEEYDPVQHHAHQKAAFRTIKDHRDKLKVRNPSLPMDPHDYAELEKLRLENINLSIRQDLERTSCPSTPMPKSRKKKPTRRSGSATRRAGAKRKRR